MNRGLIFAGVLLAAIAAPAHAEVVMNKTFDFSFMAYVQCANGGNGELVLLEGPRHEQFHMTTNGSQVLGGLHVDMHDITGLGLTTGDVYRAVGGLNSHVRGTLQNGRDFNAAFVDQFLVIGPGPITTSGSVRPST